MTSKQVSVKKFNFAAVWRVGSPERAMFVELESHVSPRLPSPSWVSPLHRAESEAPHRGVWRAGALPSASFGQVMGSRGGTR